MASMRGNIIVQPFYMLYIGRELTDIIWLPELSRRTLVGILTERISEGFMVSEDNKISPLYGVSKSLDRGVHSEQLAVIRAIFSLRGV